MKNFFLSLMILSSVVACSDNGIKEKGKALLPDSVLSERWKEVKILKDSIREGDLIVRCGNDFTSNSLRDFNQAEKIYSHSGIALMHEEIIFIYNNMAGDLNPDEIMRRDDVDSFLTPVNNVAVGVYRYDLSPDEINKLKSIVESYYTNKLQFDMNFDLATDNKMYCAEMIAKSIQQATDNRILISKSELNGDLKQKYLKIALNKKIVPSAKSAEKKEYWAIDNLYLNPNCHEVKKMIFGEPQKPIKFPAPENYQY